MMQRLGVYFKVWWLIAANALQEAFVNRWSNALFFFGKIVRLAMSLVFLMLLKERNLTVGDYTSDQVIVFFLTYQLVDVIAQIMYRGVYEFGNLIRSGEFDFLLGKPLSPLFRSLAGKPDIDDAIFLLPTLGITFYLFNTLNLQITLTSTLLYLGLLVNSLLIATAFHIFVLAFGVVTTEVDNLIWTYRDVTRLGQFPISLYMEPFRTALFFILPLGFMFTVPAQVLINTSPSFSLLVTSVMGVGFLVLSLYTWNWSLKKYSSASS